MAWFLFDDRETYIQTIQKLIEETDLDTLDKVCKFLVKTAWPGVYTG